MATKTIKSYQEPGKRLQLIRIYNDKWHVYIYKVVLNRRIIATTYNLESGCRNFVRECYKLASQMTINEGQTIQIYKTLNTEEYMQENNQGYYIGKAESIQAPNHE